MTLVNNILTILDTKIYPGESKEIDFDVANLHTSSPVNVPIIIERAKKQAPLVLFKVEIVGSAFPIPSLESIQLVANFCIN